MEKIKLILMNDTAYMWNVEDWENLRKLRIVGNFIGCLAALPRQDQLAGLPLALLKEETKLLLDLNYAEIKQISNIIEPINEDVQIRSKNLREKVFEEQAVCMKNKRKIEIESKIDIILEGKRAKKRQAEEKLDREAVLEEELKKLELIKPSNLAVQLSIDDPWIEDKDYQNCIWDYPKCDEENLRYAVFKNLWKRGYYVTLGVKFGGDYLAYPGDPIKFHAFFIVICVNKESVLKMNEIITYGRLGQSVRKTVVLAYLNDDEVHFQSIQWSGF